MDSWFVKDAIQSKEIKQFIKKLLTSKAEQMEKIEEWNESYCKEDENLLLEIKKEVLEILKK